jgi:ATP-dependent DNA ligase
MPDQNAPAAQNSEPTQIVPCVIIGYVRSKHGFRSLLVATHREGALRYVGELSVGWTREEGAELARRLPALVRPGPIVPCRKQAVWLQPERYCRVRSLGWTHRGRLRGASFAGLIER